jgi:hypothetical protein
MLALFNEEFFLIAINRAIKIISHDYSHHLSNNIVQQELHRIETHNWIIK